jgi:hypothetical protein
MPKIQPVSPQIAAQMPPTHSFLPSASGQNLTIESRLGFPVAAMRASLTHANRNIHHIETF